MNPAGILLSAFVISFVALVIFIWSQRIGLFDRTSAGAEVIFAPGEIGRAEEPAATDSTQRALQGAVDAAGTGGATRGDPHEIAERAEADASTGPLIFFFYFCAMVWLLVASAAGLTASIKLHDPDWLTSQQWLTFGIIRTIHLNSVAYGWAPMAGLGTVLFVIPRVLKTPLIGMRFAFLGAILWNAGLIAGLGAIAAGFNAGLMWLEMPWQVSILIAVGGALIGMPLVLTLVNRRVEHLYVSVWYMGAALFWFPVLFITAKLPFLYHGVQAATMNWWFGHNVLGCSTRPWRWPPSTISCPKSSGARSGLTTCLCSGSGRWLFSMARSAATT